MKKMKQRNKKIKIIILSILGIVLIMVSAFTSRYLYCEYKRNSIGYIPTLEQLEKSIKYERVIIIGVDGAGSHFRDVDTPNFDKIFLDGSINYESLTQFEADSAPNWGSMLHGVKYIKHRVHNGDSGLYPYTNDKYPSIFKIAHDTYPDMKGLSISNWPNINTGLIEDFDYISKISTGDDDLVVQEFINNFLIIDPKITFLCFDEVDAAGHGNGISEKYYDAIKRSDTRIGQIYDFLEEHNKVNDTLFILAADHGHAEEGGHGFTFPIENEDIIRTTIAVEGKLGNVMSGANMGKAVTHDVASIALYAIGVVQPSNFDGRVPYNIFTDLK